jgi:hypothetical protein
VNTNMFRFNVSPMSLGSPSVAGYIQVEMSGVSTYYIPVYTGTP